MSSSSQLMRSSAPVRGGGRTAGYRLVLALAVAAAGLALLGPAAPGAARPAAARPAAAGPLAAAARERVQAAYGMLPLAFVANAGQTDARVRYSTQLGGMSVFLTRTEAVLALTRGSKGAALALRFLGADPAAVEGRKRGPGRVNYLLGNDPSGWHTGLPSYGEVVYRNLWPGVDLVFRGAGGRLKYEFVLRPGARVADVRLAYRGAGALSLDRAGNLRIATPVGVLRDERPVSYQPIGGRRVPVASRFALAGGRSFGFTLAAYDRRRPLVIDPGLVYSTFLGGTGSDWGLGIAVDGGGNAYVTGYTDSGDFPTTAGAFDTTSNGGGGDVFVSKLDADGSGLLYSTYLGGTGFENGSGIAVDGGGAAYVTGFTDSGDFPTTAGAFDTSYNDGGGDAFVSKLNADGSGLLYSTYLGGTGFDLGLGIAVDGGGGAHVTGFADADFPTTAGAFDTTSNGGDAFVSKLNADGSGLLYSTYLGGTGFEQGTGIAVDGGGGAYVTGFTDSGDFPTTAGAFDTSYNGGGDAFVSKLNADGSGLLYSTFLGGTGYDIGAGNFGAGIAVDGGGAAYVTGFTDSVDFPTTAGAFDPSYNGGGDAFVTKLDPAGGALVYSTYLGGSSAENPFGGGIAVDSAGNAYVTGFTDSGDFPTTAGAFDTSYNGGGDAFVTKLDPAGGALVYSTYLGGSSEENLFGSGIAVDSAGAAYVTGYTFSGDFPTTAGAFDTSYNGGGDAFVSKLDLAPPKPAFMTGGGEFDPAGPCTGNPKNDKASFGGNASGRPGDASSAKGHFSFLNHCSGVRINGPVTAIVAVDELQRKMTFRVTDGSCTATVTWQDVGEPGRGQDTIALSASGTCAQAQPQTTLTKGNLKWHENVRGGPAQAAAAQADRASSSGSRLRGASSGLALVAGSSGSAVSAAGAATFPPGTPFAGLAPQRSTFGIGVVIDAGGSARGDLLVVIETTSLSGQARSITLEGKPTSAVAGAAGALSVSGTGRLDLGDGSAPATVPFNLAVTTTGLQLTAAGTKLPAQTLTAGSITID